MAETSLARQERCGRYEILAQLATGGMAEIRLARALGIQGFEKLVVIKRMLPELARKPELVTMFLDEARIAATLLHPNIVQVHDIGEADGKYFLAMEFLHGADASRLQQRLSALGRPLPTEHVVQILLGIAAALQYAHEKVGTDGQPLDLIHRDVSPSNVMITFDGGVKLLDFGIAKARDRSTATRHDTIKGKLRYMSPEQCLNERLDRRSDLFSLCILGWELVTGRRLFWARSEFATLKLIADHDAPSPLDARPDCPRELERILMKGLRRRRQERYQTALELSADLEAFAADRRLGLSTASLARFMREIFDDAIAAWERAQRGGRALEFLVGWTGGHSRLSSSALSSLPPREQVTCSLPAPAAGGTTVLGRGIAPALRQRRSRRRLWQLGGASVLALLTTLTLAALERGGAPGPAAPAPVAAAAATPAPIAARTGPAAAAPRALPVAVAPSAPPSVLTTRFPVGRTSTRPATRPHRQRKSRRWPEAAAQRTAPARPVWGPKVPDDPDAPLIPR